MKKLSLILALGLAACQPGDAPDNGGETADKSPPALEAGAVITPTEAVVASMKVPEALSVEAQDDGTIIITGTNEAALSSGWTEGVAFTVDGDAEAELSSTQTTIKILARSATGEPADMKVAYSTNEVGNSGWKTFSLGDDYDTYEFDYTINPMANGNGDYIGIIPVSTPVQVAAVGYDINGTFEPEPVPAPEPEMDMSVEEDGSVEMETETEE